LKGTDGSETVQEALKRGATPVAPGRTVEALTELQTHRSLFEIFTSSGEMGEEEARASSFTPTIVRNTPRRRTTADDTKETAKILAEKPVDLLLFTGGDGTAGDILDAIDSRVPVLGIPAGVKMHSSVFAINPSHAAKITIRYLLGELPVAQAEVMDVDEAQFRAGRLSAKLYGYMSVPQEPLLMQGIKTATTQTEDEVEQQRAIAKHVIEEMHNELYVLGPGTTVKAIADMIGVEKTLLGVDVVCMGRLVAKDVDERRLLELIQNRPVKIVVTPIGGQAYILGRGNQQISPAVIKKAGRENIIVVATRSKLLSLPHRRLLVDTGDRDLDKELQGYVRVITDYREETVMKVE